MLLSPRPQKLFVNSLVNCVWNVMAHAQKQNFFFRRNGRVHLNRWGREFCRLLAVELCASAVVMLETPCSEVVWRVLATHSIRQFPLHFPSRPSPCAITFQLDWMVFLKTRPLVKRNKAEFINVPSFTSLRMCSTHCTLFCRILILSLPTSKNFFKFLYYEITGESAWPVLFRPPWCYFLLWQLKVIGTGLTSILDFWYAGPSYLVQEVLILYFCLYLVSCTQKMRWRAHSLADTVPNSFDHFTVFLRTE